MLSRGLDCSLELDLVSLDPTISVIGSTGLGGNLKRTTIPGPAGLSSNTKKSWS